MRRGDATRIRLRPADVAVVVYAIVSGAVVAVGAPDLGGWAALLAARVLLIAGVLALATIARPEPIGAIGTLRAVYPLLVCPLFFWEAPRLAGALWEGREWWMEPALAAMDHALFGAPSVPAAFDLPGPVREALWLLYFAYYPLVAAGLLLAWRGSGETPWSRPSDAFEPVMTATLLGFLGAYLWFPFLPARAPVHALDGVAGASGGAFGAAVGWVQGWGGVTGSAFPSAHVSAAWAIVLALAADRRGAAALLGAVAAGMTIACVYTPYHWAGDVVAGLGLGIVAGLAGPRIVSRRGFARAPRGSGRSRASARASPDRA